MDYIERARKFRAKKRLGQNFLIDLNVIDEILSHVYPDDNVLEIGAGLGFVTEQLVECSNKVVALEIDKDAIKILNKNLSPYNNFELIEQDILKTNLAELPFGNNDCTGKIKIVANIPYYITSPILAHLLGEIDDINNKNRACIDEIILMVQYEVAKRLVADNNSKNKEYGSLTFLAQMWADVEIIKKVSKKSFFPSPKVDSALVKIKINDKPKVAPTRLLRRTIKACFQARRKNIKNSLTQGGFLGVNEVLGKLNIDFNSRAEKFSFEDFSKLAIALEEFNIGELN